MQAVHPIPPDAKSADPVEKQDASVAVVAAFFPPTDFLNYGKDGQNGMGRGVLAPFKAAFDFREIDPKTNTFATVTDEKRLEEIGHQISPVYHISKSSPPILILHGDADPVVPIQQAELFKTRMDAADVPCKLIIKPGAFHGWPKMQDDMTTIADWFDEYL
jgi:acetyl esterase/lipase